MADENENPNADMLSRRMQSGRRRPESDAEQTQAMDPADLPSAPAGGSGASPASRQAPAASSGRPSMISEEEWALINGTAPAAGPRESEEPVRAVEVPRGRQESRWGALGVIGTIWIALTVPFVLAAVAVRAVASPLFLRFEYFWRPGFPADEYGWSADERQHYASYVLGYLHNFDGSRYLADVVLPSGQPVFLTEEIAHMQDVKFLISLLYLIAIVMGIIAVIFMLLLSRSGAVGVRPGLFWGSLVTLLGFAALGVLGALDFDAFFTGFHQVFFDAGTWQFYVDDALIRLFPQTFWVDAGIAAAAIVLIVAITLLLLNLPRRRRRH